MRNFEASIQSIFMRRPTLEDVLIHLTGHEICDEELDGQAQTKQLTHMLN